MIFLIIILLSQNQLFPQKAKERAKYFNDLRFLNDKNYYDLKNFDYKDSNVVFEQLGPFSTNIINYQSQGIGRINDILLDEVNTSNIIIGAASGGLWKTSDAGKNWEYIKSEFGIFGVSKIYKFKNRIYILTGDSELSNLSSAYSIGLLYTDDDFQNIKKLHISNNQKLLLTSLIEVKNKLYLTSNEGLHLINNNEINNIYQIENGILRSIIEYKNKLYFSYLNDSMSEIIEYDYNLSTFKKIYSDSTSRIEIINPISDKDFLYALIAEKNLTQFKIIKTNNLTNWTNILINNNILVNQLDYNLAIEIAPYSKNTILLGGVPFLASIDNFNSFTQNKDIHFDIHAIKFHPLTNDIYVASDGGLHKISSNFAETEFLSKGKSITQFFDFDVSPNNKDIISAGAMDNGTILYKNKNWDYIGAGDGMTTKFIDDQTIITSTQRGRIFKNNLNQAISFLISQPITNNLSNPFYTLFLYQNDSLFYFSNQFAIYDIKNNNLSQFSPNPDLITAAIKENNKIYYAFKGTIVEYNLDKNETKYLTDEDYIISHLKLIDNKLYFSSSSYDNPGLFYLDLNTNLINQINENLSKIPVNNFDILDNKIYFGTDKGLYLFNNNEITKFQNDKIDIGVVSKIKIRNEFDYLYLSTFSNGMFRLKLNNCNLDNVNINLQDTLTICKGDSVKLDILNYNSENIYTLNNGEVIDNNKYIKNEGEYFVIADSKQCKNNSQIFYIKFKDSDEIKILAPNGLEVCHKDSVQLIINNPNIENQNVIWNNGKIGKNIFVNGGEYYAKILTQGECDLYSDTITVIKNPLPLKPIIAKEFNVISSNFKVNWYFNDSLIASNSDFIYINGFGKYHATSENENCTNSSDTILIMPRQKFKIYPNPTDNELNFELFIEKDIKISLEISDLNGRIVYKNKYDLKSKPIFDTIDVSYLIKGVYIISVEVDNTIISDKFLKQ